jgi:hypothetical protein
VFLGLHGCYNKYNSSGLGDFILALNACGLGFIWVSKSGDLGRSRMRVCSIEEAGRGVLDVALHLHQEGLEHLPGG